ncbi:MAG: Flp pilus assembly complex ATPase component TadA [Clostridia bacterium]|nr:Flp pilus assembly complex ATPase component TadA [Clostridia bacterium]
MLKRKKDNLKHILKYFPTTLSEALLNLEDRIISELFEINIRSERPVVLLMSDGKLFFTKTGRLTPFFSNNLLLFNENEVKAIFERMCNYSVYSQTNNIVNGFITIENGCRVGVYGTAVNNENSIASVRNICGLNVRLASECNGVASSAKDLMKMNKKNILICGPPSSGKTTFLKDFCRCLSDDLGYKLSVIDERSEFKDYYLGFNTDILSNYPKAKGTLIALRTLSPEVIVFDELGSVEEAEAVVQGINSGVAFVMSIHCGTKEEALLKKQVRILLEFNSIDFFIFLKKKTEISEIVTTKEILDAYGGAYDDCNFLRSFGTIRSPCFKNESSYAGKV